MCPEDEKEKFRNVLEAARQRREERRAAKEEVKPSAVTDPFVGAGSVPTARRRKKGRVAVSKNQRLREKQRAESAQVSVFDMKEEKG